MKHFTVYCPRSGTIIRSGTCQDHMVDKQARYGEGVLEMESIPGLHVIDLVNMERVDKPPLIIEPSYQLLRHREYPPTGDQLDAIWKALHGMPLSQEGEDMRVRVAAVKAKYPKP